MRLFLLLKNGIIEHEIVYFSRIDGEICLFSLTGDTYIYVRGEGSLVKLSILLFIAGGFQSFIQFIFIANNFTLVWCCQTCNGKNGIKIIFSLK